QKANQAVIDHLQAHRRALGLDRENRKMTYETWQEANPEIVATLSDEAKASLQTAWNRDQKAPPTPPAAVGDSSPSFDDILREDARVKDVTQKVKAAMMACVGEGDKIKRLQQIGESAIREKWDTARAEIALLREERSVGPIFYSPKP